MDIAVIILSVIVGLFVLYFIYRGLRYLVFKAIFKFPLEEMGYTHVPAIPFQIDQAIKTLYLLDGRSVAVQTSKLGHNNSYQLGDVETSGFVYMYGDNVHHITPEERDRMIEELEKTASSMVILRKLALKRYLKKKIVKVRNKKDRLKNDEIVFQDLSLEEPEQYAMGWTNFYHIYRDSKHLIKEYSESLKSVEAANEMFWPMIAQYGESVNLLIIKKVTPESIDELRAKFTNHWSEEMEALTSKGLLYFIDMSLFEKFEPKVVHAFPRFAPGSITLLKQDPKTKKITPMAVRLTTKNGKEEKMYIHGKAADGAWIYALQAAKTSIYNYGVWIGHVYQWHLPVAAMKMTLFKAIKDEHPIAKLMNPMMNYVVGFDSLLVLAWDLVSPATMLTSSEDLLKLFNIYGEDHHFLDDDPYVKLEKNHIDKEDFSLNEDWDQYKIVDYFTRFYSASHEFAKVFVSETYKNNEEIQKDKQLQRWIKLSTTEGNIKGLPEMKTKEALERVLASLIYRINIHGISRMIPALNPVGTFVGNYPPCLQKTDLVDPRHDLSTDELMKYMPNTGTVGEAMTFYSLFSFSAPYETAIPLGGVEYDLFFDQDPKDDPKNVALIQFRLFLEDFIEKEINPKGEYSQLMQWPRNIET